MDVLLLRFDAPLMSFGAPIVDERGVIQEHPPLSLVTGLIGNALGYDHRQTDRLQSIQSRLRIAARCDRRGRRITDFQTVDLGQPAMAGTGWTTRGRVEGRAGGSAREATHIRTRDFLADAVYTVAVALVPPDSDPTIAEIESAIDAPERPLFIGRKSCLPAARIVIGRCEALSLRDALQRAPRIDASRTSSDAHMVDAWWPDGDGGDSDGTPLPVTDERDWPNQIHGGQRIVRHGTLRLGEADR